jgi:hypothetical protein
MPCTICNHTVQNIGIEGRGQRRIFWCPRCGSLKTERGDSSDTRPPELVERVRAVAGTARECISGEEPSFAIGRRHWLTLCESIAVGEHIGG